MKTDYPIELLCETLQVSRSGYYAWQSGARSRRTKSDAALCTAIREVFAFSRQTYGYPRMTVELRSRGLRAGKARVARLMRACQMQGRQPRRYKPRTTQSNHDGPIAPNRLANHPGTQALDQVWRTDITYGPTAQGWLYVAVIIDAHSRRILAQSFSQTLASEFVIRALQMAIARRGGKCAAGLVLHSDRGVQYASERFRAQLAAHRISASMSRRGNCYDNALAESFFSTLKIELVDRHRFETPQDARQCIFEWIEAFYNLRRRHSSIGYLCPVDFEKLNN
jgi:transposase InsO family protein